MSLSRVDVEASASSGVWRSPSIPLAHLAVTVRSAAGGAVNVWWSQPVSDPLNAPTPDRTIASGQSLAISTGWPGSGNLYIADAAGLPFDVIVSSDTEPVPVQSTTPPAPHPLVKAFNTTFAAGGGRIDIITRTCSARRLSLGIYAGVNPVEALLTLQDAHGFPLGYWVLTAEAHESSQVLEVNLERALALDGISLLGAGNVAGAFTYDLHGAIFLDA